MKKKKDLFWWRSIAIYCLFGAVIAVFASAICYRFFKPLENVFFGLCIALMLAYLLICYLYWRCPSCGHRFAIRRGAVDNIEKCPYCYHRLRGADPAPTAQPEKKLPFDE